jgi:chaperonin GroES
MKNIKAINDIVVAEEIIKREETTAGGLIVPQTVKVEPQKYGKVLSIGEKVDNIKVGDIIVFHQSAGQAVIMEGMIQRVLKKDEIYGIFQDS